MSAWQLNMRTHTSSSTKRMLITAPLARTNRSSEYIGIFAQNSTAYFSTIASNAPTWATASSSISMVRLCAHLRHKAEHTPRIERPTLAGEANARDLGVDCGSYMAKLFSEIVAGRAQISSSF